MMSSSLILKQGDFGLAGGAKMDAELFDDMLSGFHEAGKYRRGEKARLRVARFSSVNPVLKPKEIRKVRTTLGLSQRDFAIRLKRFRGESYLKKSNPGGRQGIVCASLLTWSTAACRGFSSILFGRLHFTSLVS